MKLIIETIDGNDICITESKQEGEDGKKHLFIEGIFAQAELPNRNKRVYPKKVLENAVETYNRDFVLKKRALGEINHPNSPTVDPAKACILIESLVWKNNDVYGKAKVLSTPQGELLARLIQDGVHLGVSTRGLGSISKTVRDGQTVSLVESDYSIKAIDVVHSPSGIDCFVDGIYEGVEYYYENGILTEKKIDEIHNHIQKNDINAIQKDFSSFLKRCSVYF